MSFGGFLQQCLTEGSFSLYTVLLSKKEKYSLGNILDSPVLTASRADIVAQKTELRENRQLAYLKVKGAPTENLL